MDEISALLVRCTEPRPLGHQRQLDEDNRLTLTAIFSKTPSHESLLTAAQFSQFPESIKKLFDTDKEKTRSKVETTKYMASALIAYKKDPSISEENLAQLKNNEVDQSILIHDHKINKSVSKINTVLEASSLALKKKVRLSCVLLSQISTYKIKDLPNQKYDHELDAFIQQQYAELEKLISDGASAEKIGEFNSGLQSTLKNLKEHQQQVTALREILSENKAGIASKKSAVHDMLNTPVAHRNSRISEPLENTLNTHRVLPRLRKITGKKTDTFRDFKFKLEVQKKADQAVKKNKPQEKPPSRFGFGKG
ncbi:MAG: hypothetical protein K0U24_03035 [Gammaproteobacteria bacterium]|nr:hypothetical protein [Gammaproteobacteria bacterium]MCH9763192.1 hypothetical protein [Gammaproteobacteria bacterium]